MLQTRYSAILQLLITVSAVVLVKPLMLGLCCRAIPKPLGIMAGTIPCPECKGRPKVHLYGANLEDVLNLALPWDFKVGLCC